MSEPKRDEPAHVLVRLSGWFRLGLFRALNPTERDVFLAYCVHANKKGTAWQSARTTGELTGHSRRRIFEALRVLRRLKLLEQVGRTSRKGREEEGAIGPMIYVVPEPPASLPEGFALSVRAARTAGPLGVRGTRTHSTAKGDGGRFVTGLSTRGVTPTVRAASMPEYAPGAKPSTRHAHRKGSEGEKLQGENIQGERVQGEGGLQRPSPLVPPALSLSPEKGKEPEGEAGKGEEEQTIRSLQGQLEQFPPDKRQTVAQHLATRRGYPAHLVERALLRAGNGAGSGRES